MYLLSMTMYGLLLLLAAVFLFSPHTFDQVCAHKSRDSERAQIRWRRTIEKEREHFVCGEIAIAISLVLLAGNYWKAWAFISAVTWRLFLRFPKGSSGAACVERKSVFHQ